MLRYTSKNWTYSKKNLLPAVQHKISSTKKKTEKIILIDNK